MTFLSDVELSRIERAREYVHDAVCPLPGADDVPSCSSSASETGIYRALRVLDTDRRDMAAVRLALHDADCRRGSECVTPQRHANRSQRRQAAALYRWHAFQPERTR